MRAAIKAALERTLIWSGVTRLHRRRMSGHVLVLAYHNVVPDDETPSGDLANHLLLSNFSAQLEMLAATHDVVPLAAALEPARRGSTRPRAAITFDDAYRGAVVHAVPELVRRGFPATIFVAPSFVGGHSFWWDELARPGGGGLDPAARDHALNELRGEDTAVRAWAAESGQPLTVAPSVARAASDDEIVHAAAQPGITLGSHTWGHPNLTRLTPRELETELTKPLAWLRQRISGSLPWLAYPYGLFDETVARAAAAAGYQAGLAIAGGWIAPSSSDRFALPRVNVPRGMSVRGFVLRAAGLLAN